VQVHKLYSIRHSECTVHVLAQTQRAFLPPNNYTVHIVYPTGLKNTRENRRRHNQVVEYAGKLTQSQNDAYAGKQMLSEADEYAKSRRHRHIEESGEEQTSLTNRRQYVQKDDVTD
jgi:hypothetical protein